MKWSHILKNSCHDTKGPNLHLQGVCNKSKLPNMLKVGGLITKCNPLHNLLLKLWVLLQGPQLDEDTADPVTAWTHSLMELVLATHITSCKTIMIWLAVMELVTSFPLSTDWSRTEEGRPTRWGIFWTRLHRDLPGLDRDKKEQPQVSVQHSASFKPIQPQLLSLVTADSKREPTLEPWGDGGVVVFHLLFFWVGQSLNDAIWTQVDVK